jgi:hypothetical protein
VHEGLAAGDDGHAPRVSGCVADQFGYRKAGVAGCVPAFLDVTPNATDIATGEPDEIGGFAAVVAFALERVEALHDGEGR